MKGYREVKSGYADLYERGKYWRRKRRPMIRINRYRVDHYWHWWNRFVSRSTRGAWIIRLPFNYQIWIGRL